MKNSISLTIRLILVAFTMFMSSSQLLSQWTRTASNVFLTNITDKIGIGTNTPVTKLDITGGDISINGNNILLRGGNDNNHGLGWFGAPKLFAGQTLDGPVLYGWDGGALGYANNSLQKIVLRWNNIGHVGIGTDKPEDKLQVGDGAEKIVMGSAYSANLNYGTAYIGFNASRQNSGTWSIAGDGAHNGGTTIYSDIFGNMFFSTIPSNGPTNQTNIPDITINNNAKMIISANGNVGIGSFSPMQTLDVNGNISVNNHAILLHWNNDYNHGLRYAGIGQPFASNSAIDGPALYGYSGGILGLKNSGGNTEKIAVLWDINGNVGIGTNLTSNTYNNINNYFKLSVNGPIRAKEVIVETGWSDFVFDTNYKRMSWQEKLLYITSHKHLPAIVSAKDIETNGLNTGETMKGMMQNIEENTLDVIDLFQIIQKQDEQIKRLQKEMELLKDIK
ncbi:MAG: hypothetical protein WBP41_21965 [Saprospiraceae bacterium]